MANSVISTVAEYSALFERVGLRRIKTTPLDNGYVVIEAAADRGVQTTLLEHHISRPTLSLAANLIRRRRNGSDIFDGVFGRSPSHFTMYWKEIVEFSFYFVETFALPFAILVFVFERRKERLAEEEELNQRLSDEYIGFLKLVLDNADLQLLHRRAPLQELSEEQQERRFALFGILVSIFEGAYILVYEERMSRQTRRLWSSWEDYMREWCRRPEFRKALPELLQGEDPEFRSHIESIAKEFSG